MKVKKIILGLILINRLLATAQNPILIPDTIMGTNVDLTLQYGTHQFYSGINTNTMGVNGDVLGPTLILNQGDFVNFTVKNNLTDTTTIHWHGMHISGENDGGPHTFITPGTTWNPSFKIMDKASTYWYHPHLHRKTNTHVSKGISGFIIVKDDEEADLDLPRTYGVDDFPLVIQTKDFNTAKEIVVPSNTDDVAMVNATIDGTLEVPAQVVRLRLLNGSSMRVFNVGLEGNKTFYQIGSDGGLLEAPISLTRLQLAPGERAEILIDFASMNGQSLVLKSYASEFQNGIYGASFPGMNANMTLDNYNPNSLNGSDFNLMTFNVVVPTSSPVTAIPNYLVTVTPLSENSSDITRTLVMQPKQMGMNQLNGLFTINNVSFNLDVINYYIPLGNTEIWSIRNQSAIAHPFHIHDVQFYLLDRNGNTPAPSEQGRKDVILIKPQETVRFITKFDDFPSNIPYMYHCHMLIHEDGGMMGQFIVDTTLKINKKSEDGVLVYPNPTTDKFTITSIRNIKDVTVVNALGQMVAQEKELNYFAVTFDTKNWGKGIYFVELIYANDVKGKGGMKRRKDKNNKKRRKIIVQ